MKTITLIRKKIFKPKITLLKIFSAEDIPQSRHSQIQKYSLFKHFEFLSFKTAQEEQNKLIDLKQYDQAKQVMIDFQIKMKFDELNIDIYNLIFACISLLPGEDIFCPTETELQDKIKRLENFGLTMQTVKSEVAFFFSDIQDIFWLCDLKHNELRNEYTDILKRLTELKLQWIKTPSFELEEKIKQKEKQLQHDRFSRWYSYKKGKLTPLTEIKKEIEIYNEELYYSLMRNSTNLNIEKPVSEWTIPFLKEFIYQENKRVEKENQSIKHKI